MKRLLFIVFLLLILVFPHLSFSQTPPVIVGRVTYESGELLRYIPEDNDWTAVVKDVPVGVDDILYSSDQSRSELIFPNGTVLRIGDDTQIQMDTLQPNLSELDIASGVARIHNGRRGLKIRAISPFGYVLAETNTIFDFYVGDNSVEIVPVRGTITFIHTGTNTRYDISEGSSSILADRDQVSSGDATVDTEWNDWNLDRDSFWASRRSARSTRYLPQTLWDDAYILDQYGTWENLYYNGASRWFWRPRVAVGWGPFTVGRWSYWHSDQTWIPDEPFGYLTHHYGNWIYSRNRWYWAPPVVSVSARLPLLNIGFFWWPGRVSWIYSQNNIGWVPLAPDEPYYCHRPWGGPRTIVVNNVTINQININPDRLAYRNQSIIVPRDELYTTNNYRSVRVATRAPDIRSYRAAPVLDRALPAITNLPQRSNFTTKRLSEKPHNSVVERLRETRTSVRQSESTRQVQSQSQARSIPEGRINRQVKIPEPVTKNYLVPASRVNAPTTELQSRTNTIKKRAEALTPQKRPSITTPSSQGQVTTPQTAPTTAAKPSAATPQKPQAVRPGPTGTIAPARPTIPSPREQSGVSRQGEPAAKQTPGAPPVAGRTAPTPEKTSPSAESQRARRLPPPPPPPSAKPSEAPSKPTPEAAAPASRSTPAEKRPGPSERPAAIEKPKTPAAPEAKPSAPAEERKPTPAARSPRVTPAEKPAAAQPEKTTPPPKPAAPPARQVAPPPAAPRKAAPPAEKPPEAVKAAPAAKPPEQEKAAPEAPAKAAPPEKPTEAEKPAPPKKPSEQEKAAPEKPRPRQGRTDQEEQVR